MTVNFALFSSEARTVMLCLFTENDLREGRTTYEIELDPKLNRTGEVWHIALPGVDSSLLYGFRLSGLHQEKDEDAAGLRFNSDKVVLDPYARMIVSRRRWGELGKDLDYEDTEVLGLSPTWPQAACALPELDTFDWEGDKPLNLPMEDLVVYEASVRGFTQDPSSEVSAPGTFRGMTEKLDYLQDLGINCLELLPIFEFNELEYYAPIPDSTAYRYNYWGYSTVGFFAPMSRFSAAIQDGDSCSSAEHELKTLVKEAHKRGIEVILDVVFNHTAEGNEMGPTLSFRGLDNRVYYMLAPEGQYYNYSGCGNTFNCNQPVVRQFIVDCLRYWVQEYHIDGFRYDLASILTRAHSAWHKQEPAPDGTMAAPHSGGAIRDANGIITNGAGVPTGTPLADPAVIEMISEDPILRNTKMIAEAWDCDGLKQVGAFPHYGGRWSEWNGDFRDTIRQFIKGTDGPWAGQFAEALCGSPRLYANSDPHSADWWACNAGRKWKGGRGPIHSINFTTAHDGFSLADLVSYNQKHNGANGEDNRDGEEHNLSWNGGEEGPTDNQTVLRLRTRQIRNITTALLVSQGVPMLLMGDEYGHTKHGNNNTYCHDSPLNWFDWRTAQEDKDGLRRFFRAMIHLRRQRPELGQQDYMPEGSIQWHGTSAHKPDWSDTSRLVAFTIASATGDSLYIAFNTSHKPTLVEMPEWGERTWRVLVDTGKAAPYDVLIADDMLSEKEVELQHISNSMWTSNNCYALMPWSSVIMEAVLPPEDHPPPLNALTLKKAADSSQSRRRKPRYSSRGARTSRTVGEPAAASIGDWGRKLFGQHQDAAAHSSHLTSAAAAVEAAPVQPSPGSLPHS